jgi:hypothetical protein
MHRHRWDANIKEWVKSPETLAKEEQERKKKEDEEKKKVGEESKLDVKRVEESKLG